MTEYAWFDIGDGRKVFRRVPREIKARSHLPTPYVISDTMDPTEHLDGKLYDSKSRYRKVTKEHGCVEVGNDPARFRKKLAPRPDRKAIRETIKAASQRVKSTL